MADEKITYIDAQQMQKESPQTFGAPDKSALDAIKPENIVKVCAGHNERFWVKVTNVDGDKITGTVDNDLVMTPLVCGDEITFEKRNVYSIWED